MNTLKVSVYAFCITSTFALMGCGKLIDKLKGVSEDAGGDTTAASTDETTDAAPEDTGDAAADAAVAVVLPVGDRIPTFTGEENLAQKEINAQNYKTQLSDLDNQVKALK